MRDIELLELLSSFKKGDQGAFKLLFKCFYQRGLISFFSWWLINLHKRGLKNGTVFQNEFIGWIVFQKIYRIIYRFVICV